MAAKFFLVVALSLAGVQGAPNGAAQEAPLPPAAFLKKALPSAAVEAEQPGDKSFDMTMASMEAAMTDLMLGKTAFGATPMGGSVKQIKDLLTKTMMPKVMNAHNSDQKELNRLVGVIAKCGKTKNSALNAAKPHSLKYRSESRNHKACRNDEAVKFTSQKNCLVAQANLKQIKIGKCNAFAVTKKKLGTTKDNRAVVTKAGGESIDSYILRISTTICGKHVHGAKGNKKAGGGWGGGLEGGFLDQYLRAKEACEKAKKAYDDKVKECKRKVADYKAKKGQCNQFQNLMDGASCKAAIVTKDACESYAECYHAAVKSYKITKAKVEIEETDRTAEWRGINRMACLITAFADGKVTGKEVDACKKKVVDTSKLVIKYPKIPPLAKCAIPQLYPSTGSYKLAEFAPLPMLAKGQESIECSGVQEISTKPAAGSPKGCKCRRVSLNGAYSAGPMVMCTNCKDVRRSREKNSCPAGTKIFSPASRSDWKTFLASAKPLRAPHWIVDVTANVNGCGGCKNNAMNSRNAKQKMWQTSDGSPWWLRSTRYGEPNGNYQANCYLGLHNFNSANSVNFDDNNCAFHSKSYYCQLMNLNLRPAKGSPSSCKCRKVDLTGKYSAGNLIKCEECLVVSRSQQKNSCPDGMKLFSPRSRSDWATFIKSAQPLRAPHFIIDVTRPANGCGGCTKASMKSSTPKQATWRTSDGSPWWLRSTPYGEPNGDYKANCYLDLWRTPHNSENNIQFNDWNCNYHARSYYCQPKFKKPLPPPPPPAAPKGPAKVKVSNWVYGTLDEVPMDAKYGTAAGRSSKTCHSRRYARALPKGWELAPFKRSVLDHPWSTHCLIFKDGKSYGGSGYGKGRKCGNNMLKKDGNRYYSRACSRRIVIRKPSIPKNQLKVGKYFYMTLDEVNPSAGYGKDKGLSDARCHKTSYKRAIPQGWELAPLPSAADRKQLFNKPWSTHCLIFKDGKSYGTSTYGKGRNCGGGNLYKSGNRYAARYCSRRVLLRKK